MKKYLILFLTFLAGMPSLAFQNYMLLTDKEITNVSVSNSRVVEVEDFQSYNSENRMIMILAKDIGCSKISFCKGNKKVKLSVKVKPNETCIKAINGVKLIPVDLPSELYK